MRLPSQFCAVVVGMLLLAAPAAGEETKLFNGQDLAGWKFYPQSEDDEQVEDPWVAQRGMLICRGLASGCLMHEEEFADYVLTLELRTMSTEEGGGVAVGSLGSLYVNAAPERAEVALEPKSIEISIHEPGDVFFRDIDRETFFDRRDEWLHPAPDFADDVEREMGEWNQLKVICNGDRLTVILNGNVVNQVESLNRTKGAVGLKSSRGFVAAPTFYRNLVVRPITAADLELEKQATTEFAEVRSALARRQAVEEARRAEQERREAEAERAREEIQQKLAKEWSDVDVAQDVEFIAEATRLPFPKDARELEFRAVFGMVEFESPSSLAKLSDFYRIEMARRGWKATETEIEEDEVTVTFQQGEAEVELNLDESSDYVDVSLDCEGLSFEGTDDPAALVELGVPQPKAYLVLQSEFMLPEDYRDQQYDGGDRRLFKSTLSLPELYEFLTKQLRAKGYRETRRPIVTEDRRYSEFAKRGVEISVNAFAHEIGSRVVLTYED